MPIHEIVQYILAALLFALCLFALGKRFFRGRIGPTKTVRARVVDKQKNVAFSKYSGSGKSTAYIVVFEIGGKRKGFEVSEFSYGGYRIGEEGMLTYRGSRIVDFH